MAGKVELANTEQLGRLIKLCANAIELTQSNKRDPEHVYEAIEALQKLKDMKSHICSCGYPHYERGAWIGSQSYYNHAVKQLCQFRPGMSLMVRYHSDRLYPIIVVSEPYFSSKQHRWIVKVNYPISLSRWHTDSEYEVGEYALDAIHSSIGIISCENWFSFSSDQEKLHKCDHS